jgi:hypothetical protein
MTIEMMYMTSDNSGLAWNVWLEYFLAYPRDNLIYYWQTHKQRMELMGQFMCWNIARIDSIDTTQTPSRQLLKLWQPTYLE